MLALIHTSTRILIETSFMMIRDCHLDLILILCLTKAKFFRFDVAINLTNSPAGSFDNKTGKWVGQVAKVRVYLKYFQVYFYTSYKTVVSTPKHISFLNKIRVRYLKKLFYRFTCKKVSTNFGKK